MSPISQFHFAEDWPQAENEKKKKKNEEAFSFGEKPIKAISQFYFNKRKPCDDLRAILHFKAAMKKRKLPFCDCMYQNWTNNLYLLDYRKKDYIKKDK